MPIGIERREHERFNAELTGKREPKRIRTVYNWLQYYTPGEFEVELKENGFHVDGLYSDVAGSPYDPNASEFVVIAKRI